MTHYLPDTGMPWSRMFGIMEYAKRELHVEDYSISQTTLEQIFLQFTKYQHLEEVEQNTDQGNKSKSGKCQMCQPDIRIREQGVRTWKRMFREKFGIRKAN